MTKRLARPDPLTSPGGNQPLRGIIWAITGRRLHSRVAMGDRKKERKNEGGKKGSFAHRGSRAHLEHIIVIWFVYRLITARSDYRRGNKGRRMECGRENNRWSLFTTSSSSSSSPKPFGAGLTLSKVGGGENILLGSLWSKIACHIRLVCATQREP